MSLNHFSPRPNEFQEQKECYQLWGFPAAVFFPCLSSNKNNQSWRGFKQIKVEADLAFWTSKAIPPAAFHALTWVSPRCARLHSRLAYHSTAFVLFQIVLFEAISYSSEMANLQSNRTYSNFMTVLVKYFPCHSLCIFQGKVQIISGNSQMWRPRAACLSLMRSVQEFQAKAFPRSLPKSFTLLGAPPFRHVALGVFGSGFLLRFHATSPNILPSTRQRHWPQSYPPHPPPKCLTVPTNGNINTTTGRNVRKQLTHASLSQAKRWRIWEMK